MKTVVAANARMTGTVPEHWLVVRADADARIGAGHVSRCLALVEAWHQSGGRTAIVSRCESEVLRQQLTRAGAVIVPLAATHPDPADIAVTLDVARRRACDWIVIDGYAFDPIYQEALRDAGARVLVIDDMAHWSSYRADALLNQNLRASADAYAGAPGELMLGTRFALLRAEFLRWRGWQREIPDVARRVLVTLGGADPHDCTATVIDALHEVGRSDLEVVVVIGANNDRADAMAVRTKGDGPGSPAFRLVRHTAAIAELMAWADVAISGAGSTCWELAFMGLPALLIVLAENQQESAHALEASGYGVCVGAGATLRSSEIATEAVSLLSDRTARADMAARGPRLVDGLGADRVVRRLRARCGQRA